MRERTFQAMLFPLFLILLLLQPSYSMTLMEVVLSGAASGEQSQFSAGWKAAAASLNANSNAQITSITSSVGSNNVAQSIVNAAGSGTLAVFGLYDDAATSAVMSSSAFNNANLVLFGPFTESPGVRQWSNNVYFMSADPMSELVVLLNWAFSTTAGGAVKFTNVGWMYLTGSTDTYSDTLTTMLATEITSLGYRTPVTYLYPTSSTFSTNNFNAFMAMNPTCLFLFGARGAHTTSFFTTLIQNAYVKDSSNSFYIMMPFALMYSTGIAYQSQKANAVSYNNLRYSAPLPVPTNTSFSAAQSFQSDIVKYGGASSSTLGSTTGYFMFYGWVFMQQIYYIGNTYNFGGGTNRAAIKTNVFMQNRYNIQDIVLGNYGGVCPSSGKAAQLGAACKCNQGGHFITVVKVTGVSNSNNMGLLVEKDWDTIFPNTPCYPTQDKSVTSLVTGYRSSEGVIVNIQDNAVVSSLASQMNNGFSRGISNSYGAAAGFSLTYSYLNAATASEASASVTAAAATSPIGVISGPVTAEYTPESMSNYLFVDPISVPLSLNTSSASNVVYISATTSQQFAVVANYLAAQNKAGKMAGGVHLRYRTDEVEELTNMVGQTLGYYGVPLSSSGGVGLTVFMADVLPTAGYTFLWGIVPSDLIPLKNFLTANPQSFVIISFDELTVNFTSLTAAWGTSSDDSFTNQILFATNIPHWKQSGSSTIFQKFVGSLPADQCTPAAMRGFLAARAVVMSNNQGQGATSNQVIQQWYNAMLITLDGMTIGPYLTTDVLFPSAANATGAVNYGARNIAVWNYGHAVNPNTAFVAQPVTLPALYSKTLTPTLSTATPTSTTKTPASTSTTTSTTTTTTTLPPCIVTTTTTALPTITTTTTTTTTTTGAPHTTSDTWKYAVVAILAAVLVAGVLFAIQLCCTVLPCFGGERFHSAPVDFDAPTTIVFVEVDKWPEVQRLVPDAAAECLVKYRNIVRRLSDTYDCYETGSLNDAFMLVARNPSDGLQFAGALQKKVQGMHGSSVDAVDAAYADIGLPSGAVHGLRVRVGVHTDVVDIAYDVDTDHYEYRGAGCIAALRTERFAHGGQVLVTGATCEALTEKQLAGVHAVSVGTKSFPEYEEPVPLFELVVLQHREFGGFQSDPVPVCTGDPALSMCTESAVLRDEELAEIALTREVLSIAFSPLPVKQRIKALTGECQLRGIRVPAHQRKIPDKSYATVLLDLLVYYTFMNTPKTALPYSAAMMDDAEKHKKNPQSTTTATSNYSAIDRTTDETTTENVRQGDDGSSNNDYLVLAQRGEEANPQFSQLSDSNRSLE